MKKPQSDEQVYWHGTPSGDLRGGPNGLHLGTEQAAREALTARIGHRADGKDWDGTQEYGKTKIAGTKTLERRGITPTGYHASCPEEDHFPTGTAKYGDGTAVPMHVKPEMAAYRLKGEMTNSPETPHEDFKANGLMSGQIKRGKAKRGYYYQNVGEDSGSLSIVVPHESHVEKIGLKKSESLTKARFEEGESPEEKQRIRGERHSTIVNPPVDPNQPHWSKPDGGESIAGVMYREGKEDIERPADRYKSPEDHQKIVRAGKSAIKEVKRYRRREIRKLRGLPSDAKITKSEPVKPPKANESYNPPSTFWVKHTKKMTANATFQHTDGSHVRVLRAEHGTAPGQKHAYLVRRAEYAMEKTETKRPLPSGYSISHKPFGHTGTDFHPGEHDFTVEVHKDGKRVAYGSFYHEGRLYPAEVEVSKMHRRKGIASAMYDHAQELSGKTVHPSDTNPYAVEPEKYISDDAKAFWANRLKKSEPSKPPKADEQFSNKPFADKLTTGKKLKARFAKIKAAKELKEKDPEQDWDKALMLKAEDDEHTIHAYRGAKASNAEIKLPAWFTSDPKEADVYNGTLSPTEYIGMKPGKKPEPKPGSQTQPVRLKMKNPYKATFGEIANANEATIARLKEKGHDGMHYEHKGKNWYVPFDHSQIKSKFEKSELTKGEEDYVTLYHGTTPESAKAMVEKGWKPNQASSGANQGRPDHLYLSTHPEDAQWFAEQKGSSTVLKVKVPKAHLKVDPEDGCCNSVHEELNHKSGTPGKLVAHLPIEAAHFSHHNDELEKGFKEAALGVAAAAGIASASIGPGADLPPAQVKVAQPFKPAIQLRHELETIAQIESSGGKNKNHPTVTYGLNSGHRAGGSTGLMPITVMESVKKNPELKHKYGHLLTMKHHEITDTINSNPEMEADIANHHWARLDRVFGSDHARKAYAWNQGITGAKRATHEQIHEHPYVQKFMSLKKSEDLLKMPLIRRVGWAHQDTLEPGQDVTPDKYTKGLPAEEHVATTQLPSGHYHHVLRDSILVLGGGNTKQYRHVISEHADPKMPGIAGLRGFKSDGEPFKIASSFVHPTARRQGIGSSMYKEAARHWGEVHSDGEVSPEAHKLWQSLGKDKDLKISLGSTKNRGEDAETGKYKIVARRSPHKMKLLGKSEIREKLELLKTLTMGHSMSAPTQTVGGAALADNARLTPSKKGRKIKTRKGASNERVQSAPVDVSGGLEKGLSRGSEGTPEQQLHGALHGGRDLSDDAGRVLLASSAVPAGGIPGFSGNGHPSPSLAQRGGASGNSGREGVLRRSVSEGHGEPLSQDYYERLIIQSIFALLKSYDRADPERMRLGDAHPSKPYVVVKNPHNGRQIFEYNDQVKRSKENFIKRNSSDFVGKLPADHQMLVGQFINRVNGDPTRHFVAGGNHHANEPSVRARHVAAMIAGEDHVRHEISPCGTKLTVWAQRHGEYGGPRVDRWEYTKKIPGQEGGGQIKYVGAVNDLGKSESVQNILDELEELEKIEDTLSKGSRGD